MKLNLLKAGLQQLLKDGNEQPKQVQEAIAEIEEIQQQLLLDKYDDPYAGDCFVLHASDVSTLIIDATYDAYGSLFVKNGRKREAVTFDMYEKAVRLYGICNYPPRSLLEVGYEVVADLYEDNERNGCHDHDNI